MRLLKLQLRNFMRFKRAEVKLDHAGLCLIEGVNKDDESTMSNGAGKSTLVDALVWCLYGVTTHEPSAQGDDVVNERRGKNCEVSVTFQVGKYQHYEVTRRRAWKKGGKRVQLELVTWDPNTQSGAAGDMTKGTVRDTQAAIEKLIGMSVATFRHACVFGQGRAYRFSRLTDTEKKAVFDEMLGSEVYAQAGQKAGTELMQREMELSKAKASVESVQDALGDTRKRLSKLRKMSAKAAKSTRQKRLKLKERLAKVKSKLAKLDIPKTRENALVIAETNEREALMLWRKAISHAEDASRTLKQLENRRVKVKSQKGTDCITCGQPIDDKHVKRQLRELDDQIEQQNAKDHIANEASLDAKRKYDERREATKVIQRDDEARHDAKVEQRRLEDDVDYLRERLAEQSDEDDYEQLITDERNNMKECKSKLKKMRRFIKLRKRDIEQLRFWQHGFSAKGLRSLMLDSTLPYLNAKLEHYTNALTAGNIAIEFKAQKQLKGGGTREEFYIDVQNKHGSTKYNMNSIGERAKIDIIVGLALQDMAASRSRVPVNVAFFDEAFDGLDSVGTDRAIQLLTSLNRESCFVITHSSDMRVFFSRHITVVKENGESRIEQ